jgi:hypothetical protein
MFRKLFLFVIVQFALLNVLEAQYPEISYTGTKSDLQIFSNSTDLKPVDQMLVLKTSKATGSKTGKGKFRFSYQSVHLEFSINGRVENVYSANKSEKNKYKLSFFGSNGELIISILVPDHYVKRFNNPVSDPKIYFYSVDLLDIPVIILSNSVKLDITKLVSTGN